jgi:hypothetical protein
MSSSQEQFSFWLGFSRGRADLPGLFSDSLENFFFLFLIHASAIDLSPGIVFAWSLLFLLAESCCKSPVLICATPIICCIMFPHWARVLILLCATRFFFCPAQSVSVPRSAFSFPPAPTILVCSIVCARSAPPGAPPRFILPLLGPLQQLTNSSYFCFVLDFLIRLFSSCAVI